MERLRPAGDCLATHRVRWWGAGRWGARTAQVPYSGIIRDRLEPSLERVQMVR
ncbi:hypothetical protein [Actinoplanes sp. NPDC089786]|uniref:hypothetical protein n=1 Tax=Actinoplanes sp. NPDC089786 TaxID=3155185 RepID=UPI00343B2C2E